jgi:DNA adenine methylase
MPQNTVVKKKAVVAKPFVKWAGGKGNLLQKLEALLPTDFDDLEDVTYIEPFVGGGAMLFHMLQRHKCITRAVINDINADLIRCYQLIAKDPQTLIDRLKNIENNYFRVEFHARKELFYAYRDQYNSEGIHPDERAALFIFLNHTCFNGLYRVNAAGKFNVPYGRYKKPVICNEELIMADHRLLNSVELVIRQPGDYKLIRQNLSRNHVNFVYFDPPYRPLNATSSFKEYSNNPFEDRQQEELRHFCDKLSAQNCLILQSNSDSKTEDGNSYFEALYEGYDIQRILASRFINADPEKRKKLTEVVIRNY